MIDLHTHSSRSDGTDSPTELVTKAAQAEVTTLGLTDHDTTAGWEEAAGALPTGMRLVRGAEFSTYTADGRGYTVSAHLLGYLFDPAHPAILAEQRRLKLAARERVQEMLTKADVEFPGRIDLESEIANLRTDVAVGSHDVLSALTSAERTPIEDAIGMIVAAGGVAVFAHPFGRVGDGVVDSSVIRRLKDQGLGGIEVDHPDHRFEGRATLRVLAGELDLLVTGSSDYHGTNKTLLVAQDTTSEAMFERLVGAASGAEVLTG